jgi:hypothetical protein
MSCPHTWPSPVILRCFQAQIIATWTREEIRYVQRLTTLDATPPRKAARQEAEPLIRTAHRRRA